MKRQLLRSGRFVSRACLSRYKLTGTSWLLAEYAPLSLGLRRTHSRHSVSPLPAGQLWFSMPWPQSGPWSPSGDNLYVAIDVSLCNTFLHFFCIFFARIFCNGKNPSICRALRYVVLWENIKDIIGHRLIWRLKTNHQRLTKLISS